jgi:hypothetical protein
MSGPLWICGQESSLRILAWSFALFAFLSSPATTPARVSILTSMIAAHAWRAEQTLGYARSQRSNHLISEAVGLWTTGLLFPELESSNAWRDLGARLLHEAVIDQITPDGLHLQYSFSYERMVLHLLLWALRLARVHNLDLPAAVGERTRAALAFVRAFVDPVSGGAPNLGANDGSLILPLSICDYTDFRPLLQLGAAVLGSGRLDPGPWDEPALWFGAEPLNLAHQDIEPTPLPARTGFHRLGSCESWALVSAQHYQRRPFHADQLHVDVWHRGLNVACDAGTYLYNGAPPWDNAFARTAVHNTLVVDGHDQMRRAGRFLWVDWANASGQSSVSSAGTFPDRFQGKQEGYLGLGVEHHREVRYLCDGAWLIVDDLTGTGEHDLALHWLLPDLPLQTLSVSACKAVFATNDRTTSDPHITWHLLASAPGNAALIRAGKRLSSSNSPSDSELTDHAAIPNETILGWISPTYGELCPAVSLVYHVRTKLPVRLTTVLLVGDDLRLESNSGEAVVLRDNVELARVSVAPQVESRLTSEAAI